MIYTENPGVSVDKLLELITEYARLQDIISRYEKTPPSSISDTRGNLIKKKRYLQ